MAPDGKPEPVTAEEAGMALRRPPATIRVWAHRYGVVRLGKAGRHVYYDLADLRVIERELFHGHEVPATPEQRAAIRLRCPLQESRSTFHAA
jgi:hypothetical protein